MKIMMLMGLLAMAVSVWADNSWRGDFETGDLSQWDYHLNPQGIKVQSDCVYEGQHAALITLTGDESFLWHGNAALNRSELTFKPADTSEGSTTNFGWSYYLPEAWSDAKHELGYWESDTSWQQQMRFNIHGTELSFQASAADDVFWRLADGASPGQWHDIAMQVHWSSDPDVGFVRIWHDGNVMDKVHMQTRVNERDPMFTQIGILRTQTEAVERMVIDNARQADTIDHVLAGFDANAGSTCNL